MYICIERESDIHICIHICICICMYIYIYVYRERERDHKLRVAEPNNFREAPRGPRNSNPYDKQCQTGGAGRVAPPE